MRKKNILFCATEHGSWNVVYPVLRLCRTRFSVGYIGLKDIPDTGLMYKRVISEAWRPGPNILNSYDCVVTGSSVSRDTDWLLWEKSAYSGKISICLLDQHKDLKKRFSAAGSRVFPNVICVINTAAREALVRFGVNRKKIVVTGSPYLTRIAGFKLQKSTRDQIRRQMGIDTATKAITFCTEYIAKASGRKECGYDEHSVLRDIISCLQKDKCRNYIVFLRVHPNDRKALYNRYITSAYSGITFKFMEADPGYKFLQATDLVIGMTSVILVESLMLGLPVISYQPVKRKNRIFEFDQSIRDRLVISKNGLRKKISAVLNAGFKNSGEKIINKNDPVQTIFNLIRKKVYAKICHESRSAVSGAVKRQG